MANTDGWQGGDEVNKGQGATFALFVIFILLVIFVSKTGNGFWKTLFTKTDYELTALGNPFSPAGAAASLVASIVKGQVGGTSTPPPATDTGTPPPASGAA